MIIWELDPWRLGDEQANRRTGGQADRRTAANNSSPDSARGNEAEEGSAPAHSPQ